MISTLGLFIALSFVDFGACVAKEAEKPPSVAVRIAKDRFGVNEPIGISVTFENSTKRPIQLLIDDSGFIRDFVKGSVVLKSKDEQLKIRREFFVGRITTSTPVGSKTNWQIIEVHGAIVPTIVPPRGRFEGVLYLQRFYQQPPIGSHTLTYSCKFDATALKPNNEKEDFELRAAGTLEFSVVPADPREQRVVLDGLMKQIREDKRWPKQSHAIEGISVVDDAIVVPFLAKLATDYSNDHGMSSVFKSIQRFADDPKARALVIEALDSKEPCMSPTEILTVLCHWKHRLPEERLSAFRENRDQLVQAKFAQYLKLVKADLKRTD